MCLVRQRRSTNANVQSAGAMQPLGDTTRWTKSNSIWKKALNSPNTFGETKRTRSISARIVDACKCRSGYSLENSIDWLNSSELRCYWWPLNEKDSDGQPAKFGLNTRNMDPMAIYHVTRKIERAWLFEPLKNKAAAHSEDQANYWATCSVYGYMLTSCTFNSRDAYLGTCHVGPTKKLPPYLPRWPF